MPDIDARGVSITFPFEPYPCQVTYMQKVVECLQKNVNGILESPTGTGKTLCLLCSTLGWVEDQKSKVGFNQEVEISKLMKKESGFTEAQFSNIEQGLKTKAGGWGGPDFAVPKVIYATRTHSQLSQAVQELKRTAYKSVKVSVIGSREQLCINEQVKKEENNASKVHMCRNKVNARSCHYYNNLDELKKNGEIRAAVGTVVDIEDLVRFGEKKRCCPYYLSRELESDADIIFMPYNYLLDPKLRKAHSVELQGNIVIFDEAHNLEKICEESSSFDLTSTDIATAMEELTLLAEKLVDYSNSELQSVELATDNSTVPEFDLADLLKLKSLLQKLEESLDSANVPKGGSTHPGVYIFELFDKVGVTFESKYEILEVLEKIIAYLNSNGTSSSLHRKGAGLTKFADVLKIVFSREIQPGITLMYHQKCVSHSYRVHIHIEENRNKKKNIQSWMGPKTDSEKGVRVLSYWCFSPGHCMGDLVNHKVKCILLTSGTLSPISSFTTEMQISFPVQLENPHVIEKHQVWVSTIGKGPDGTLFNSSYEHRHKETYQSSLGNAIVNFARVVPNGLLIFFPSYPFMETCLECWKRNTIWSRITQYKPIFVEPRGKSAFHEAMDGFYEKINDTSLNGAIFVAVCRGKVSEGLDFSDMNGRAVVITGLPYPPMMDPKVILKMKYLDEMKNKPGLKSLTGREWYRQQASRAVNQAIGRVIRHKQDFGAIILCDDRFSSSQAQSQLPVWVKPHVKQYGQFGGAIRDLMMFFKTAEKLMPDVRAPRPRINADTSRGAHFMPSTTRHQQSVEKANIITNHVPSLIQREADDQSLAQMKIQYEGERTPVSKQTGLLDALQLNESKEDDHNLDFSTQMPSYQAKSRPNGSKKKIVIKKSGSCGGEPPKVIESSGHVTSQALQSAEVYITQVKKRLDSASYKLFSETLCAYKKSEDFSTMSVNLANLFIDQPDNHCLFRAFYKFVRPQHKEQFDKLCENLTGQGCGYSAQHSISKKRVNSLTQAADKSDKRQKLGPVSNSVDKTKVLTTSTEVCSAEKISKSVMKENCGDLGVTMVTDDIANNPLISDKQAMKESVNILTARNSQLGANGLSGYTCVFCKNDAKVPFISGCQHICCFLCWKTVLKGDKLCPKCNLLVRRRQMRRVLYPDGSDLHS